MKKDIGNSKYVRPDVWHFVDENIGQIPAYRRRTAPKHKFEPSKSGMGIDIEAVGPSSLNPKAKAKKAPKAKKALAQISEPDAALAEGAATSAPAPSPEKVSIMQPLEYQHRANTNTPNLRTTFYA